MSLFKKDNLKKIPIKLTKEEAEYKIAFIHGKILDESQVDCFINDFSGTNGYQIKVVKNNKLKFNCRNYTADAQYSNGFISGINFISD